MTSRKTIELNNPNTGDCAARVVQQKGKIERLDPLSDKQNTNLQKGIDVLWVGRWYPVR